MKRFIPYVFLLTCSILPASAFTPSSDGMYAVVSVTFFDGDVADMVTEEFTIQLTYSESPVTCANFVGLATGLLPWYDFETRQVRGGPENPEPYYDGLIFHRVIPNFVIQTGSRDGSGGDGTGFLIPNEVGPDLNHVGGGVVSMANSSNGDIGLNSGGSQFFVTMAQFPETQFQLDRLNGKHSVFGFLVEGHQISQSINRTPLDGSRPTFDATVNSITIVKEGEGANSWDPSLYWISPDFSHVKFELTNNLEDLDGDPNTDPFRSLVGRFDRYKDNQYYLQASDDLATWNSAPPNYSRGILSEDRILIPATETEAEIDNRELRPLGNQVFPGGRSFYSLLESALPPLPRLDGQQITINFDPIEDTEDDFITYVPEVLTIDFYDQLEGAWQMQRTDSTIMKPIGNILGYQLFPLGNRNQLLLDFDFFTTLQAYLSYETPSSGSAYIFWPVTRPEGGTVTGTFTMGTGEPRRVPQNKDGTRIILIVTDSRIEGQDPIVSTYTIDLWDNFSEEGLEENFEGGYTLVRSNTEFISTGRIIYQWLEANGEIYLNLDFDFNTDLQALLNSEGNGSGEVLLQGFDTFLPSTFTTAVGEPRPDAQDKEGDKLVLTFDDSGSGTEVIQSIIDIDFYDNFEGGYEATSSNTEVNQFGEVLEYEWFENAGQTRVDILFDTIAPLQAYLTFTSTDSGTASVHLPSSGQVVEATFTYTVGGGNLRPVPIDKNGTKLVLDFDEPNRDVLTINLYEDFLGTYSNTRPDDAAQPSGRVNDYDWFDRVDGANLVFIDFSGIPTMQIILDYSTETAGKAKVLFIDSGTVNTIPFTIGVADPQRQSVNKTGYTLSIDLEQSDTNILVDTEEFVFLTSTTGEFTNLRPGDTTPTTGQIEFYEWFEGSQFDQINLLLDFSLDQQVFLDYTTATTGTVTVYFTTAQNVEEGTFTIQTP
jgi:cyclophilin family peptidyl-prolyl cis-trans isomerase